MIAKKNTKMRSPIPADEKLACTLRFLATGESFTSLQYQFRISKATICLFVPEVCAALYTVLQPEFMDVPRTADAWKNITKNIFDYWQFPNCIGAMDGKHIGMMCPPCSGSTYHNYKKFYRYTFLYKKLKFGPFCHVQFFLNWFLLLKS